LCYYPKTDMMILHSAAAPREEDRRLYYWENDWGREIWQGQAGTPLQNRASGCYQNNEKGIA